MKNVINILNSVKNTSSSKDKTRILLENYDNITLKKVLYYCYNPFKMYGISESKLEEMKFEKTDRTVLDIWSMLDELSSNNINDSLRQKFCDAMALYTPEEQALIKAIVIKDLRIGVNVSTINKVWKDLIPVFKVQLANKLQDVKLAPDELIAITEKLDGIRCLAFKENETVKLFTRQGKPITGLIDIEQALLKVKGDWVFDGELLLDSQEKVDSGTLYRQTVKAVNNKQDIKTGIIFNVFDVITVEEFANGVSKTKYFSRRLNLETMQRCVFNQEKYVNIVKVLYYGKDHEQINRCLWDMESQNKEGVMINREDFYYCKRCNSLLKVKTMKTCDLEIIGFEKGLGKNSNTLGALVVDYKGYTLKVGSGFSESMRDEIWESRNELLGRVAEIQYFEETKNEQGGLSVRFPVFKCIREKGKEVSYF